MHISLTAAISIRVFPCEHLDRMQRLDECRSCRQYRYRRTRTLTAVDQTKRRFSVRDAP